MTTDAGPRCQTNEHARSPRRTTAFAALTLSILLAGMLAGCTGEGGDDDVPEAFDIFLQDDELPEGSYRCDPGDGLYGVDASTLDANPGLDPETLEWEDRREYWHFVAPEPVASCQDADYIVSMTLRQWIDPMPFEMTRETVIDAYSPCNITAEDPWHATAAMNHLVGDASDRTMMLVLSQSQWHADEVDDPEAMMKQEEAYRLELYTALNEKHPHWWVLCL